MDFETFLEMFMSFVKNSGNLYLVLYAAADCLLTQVVKKIIVDKVKVEIFHKFDLAPLLPFIFGAVFAAIDIQFVRMSELLTYSGIYDCLIECAAIGALASVIFRFCSKLSGKSLKSLQKDDVFGAFYTELVYFGNVRELLKSGKLSMKDFLSEVKLVSDNAKAVYSDKETSNEVKRMKLGALMDGIIDSEAVSEVISVLHKTLTEKYAAKEAK